MSKIILLNGPGSSGKSSIAKALQELSSDLWLTFGVDTFIEMIPPNKMDFYLKFIPGENERGPLVAVESQAEARKLFDLMPSFAELLASAGNNLIIDEVLFTEESLQLYREKLKNHQVYFVRIFCDFKTLQEREILRGDRILGLANHQIDRIKNSPLYDLNLNSSRKSPLELAKTILDFISNNSL